MRTRVLALVTLLLLAGCTARRETGPDNPAPDRATPPVGQSAATPPVGQSTATPPVGQSTATLTVAGTERTYRVYRPAGLPAAAPLVLVLHGAAGTGRQAEESYGWDAEADTGKFLAVFPDGVRRTWNADADCCGVAARDRVDDVGFLTRLAGAFPGLVDPARVYVTGISNGALMSYRLACDTKTFAAIGTVSGTMINKCDHPARVSVIAIHGTADKTIPYDGGPGRRSNRGAADRLPAKIDGPSIPALNATWRRNDGCAAPQVTTAGPVTTSTATCPSGRAVELITVAGAGHQWPGGRSAPLAQRLLGLDPPSQALQATPTIWKFFSSH